MRLARGQNLPAMAKAICTVIWFTKGYWPLVHLAQHEEWTILLHFDRNARLAQVAGTPPSLNRGLKRLGRVAPRLEQSDERHRDATCAIDAVGIGEAILPEHDDPEAISGIERVGLVEFRRQTQPPQACRKGGSGQAQQEMATGEHGIGSPFILGR